MFVDGISVRKKIFSMLTWIKGQDMRLSWSWVMGKLDLTSHQEANNSPRGGLGLSHYAHIFGQVLIR